MKKFTNLCFVLLLSFAVGFGMTACGSSDVQTETYEITVNAKSVSVNMKDIKVCLYASDGTAVKQANLKADKAQFKLSADNYVVTLSGLDETVSFSSVLLTKDSKKATIVLEDSNYDDFMEY